MFMFERPVGTNARPQGRHPLLARSPLGTHFGAKAPGCPGGMVTGQIDTCITLTGISYNASRLLNENIKKKYKNYSKLPTTIERIWR